MSNWKLTVGMEIHVELETETKMFCGCKNDPFHSEPNTNVCPVCYGLPGALPLLNKKAIELTVSFGQAIKATIPETSFWARKNYFYPDLPKGYQISQSSLPLVQGGQITIDGVDYHLNHAHLEEDAGKLKHAIVIKDLDSGNLRSYQSANEDKQRSWVDYNRAGVPLLEIVTEPDFHSGDAAKRFCQELQRIMRSLKISSADMEKGQMRCEANISVSQTDELGTKVEVKNINSFRAVEKAIEYEFDRQVKALEAGEKVIAETRGWNDIENKTVSMRTKETSADYRYFPEPDLPVVKITLTDSASHQLPEDRRKAVEAMGAPAHIATALVDKDLDQKALEFDKLSPQLTKEAAHLMLEMPTFAALSVANQVKLLEAKQANGWPKTTLSELVASVNDQNIDELIAQNQTDLDLAPIIEQVLSAHSGPVAEYKAGKEAVFHFLVGQVMAQTKGRANINTVRDELKKALAAQ